MASRLRVLSPALVSLRKAFAGDSLLLLLLTLSLAGNVYLGLRLQQVGSLTAGTPKPAAIRVGSMIPHIETLGKNGDREVVAFDRDSRPTVVFVYTPTCQGCGQAWPLFKQIAVARRDDFRFVALSVANTAGDYTADFPILSSPTPATIRRLGLTSVPKTMVIAPSGRVEKVWSGAYGGAVGRQVSAYFSLAFPDPVQVLAR